MLRALLALILSAGTAAAEPGDNVARVEVLPGWRQGDGDHLAALRISLAPGWKTYWRAPGDAGIPPRFDWSGSRNLARARTLWPAPEVFEVNGLRTIGYDGVVVLPILLQPARADGDIALAGRIEFGVCETICIPLSAEIDVHLPAAGAAPDPAIRAALADVPETSASAVACSLAPIADGMRLTAAIRLPRLGAEEAAIVELADPDVWVSEVETRRRGDVLTATAELVPPQATPFAIDRSVLRFTILSDGRAVEMRGCTPG